nr:hypothetical protein [Thiolapillus sp.]
MCIAEFRQPLHPLSSATAVLRTVVSIDDQGMGAVFWREGFPQFLQSIHHEVCCDFALREPQVTFRLFGQQYAKRR